MFESVDPSSRPNWKLRIGLTVLAAGLLAGVVSVVRMTHMPLKSYSGSLPVLSSEQSDLRDRLEAHVKYLSETIGERSLQRPRSLSTAAAYIRGNLQQAGYTVVEQGYPVLGQTCFNLEVTVPGSDSTSAIVVVGAHYDSVAGTTGANDNATGVAAVLELARLLHGTTPKRTVRFVFFVNEEPPYFQTENMGSLVYARRLRHEGQRVTAMISMETVGYYSDAPGSQKYPPVLGLLYPNRGNFIGFVGNTESRDLVQNAIRTFRLSVEFPSEGISAPPDLPGIGWSDQWSFWQEKYPAIMITDTAVFRYPYYHTVRDTADKVDFEKEARVVDGVRHVIEMLADRP
jgi:Zn-dependent M28 family amino/carboxypeptidase